eukprot:GGOE01015918.1.p1 GENE.GGOE01015918.1~~GGOE01015918.1.p1  ORF type:complete len:270 (-),score=69.86 GGOE01015918.1:97-906(-)
MPELWEQRTTSGINPYALLLGEVVRRTAELIAHWQAVGFVHGTMNTDNMAVLGFTLDCGTCQFLQAYDPGFTPNRTVDVERQYAFGRQVDAAKVNLAHFALALQSLVPMALIGKALGEFHPIFDSTVLRLYRRKLGLQSPRDEDQELVCELLHALEVSRQDFALTFELLGEHLPAVAETDFDGFLAAANVAAQHTPLWTDWLTLYAQRLQQDASPLLQQQSTMAAANPTFVLRPSTVAAAVDRAKEGDYCLVRHLLRAVRTPFQANQGR